MKTCPTPGVTEASSELKTSQAARPRQKQIMQIGDGLPIPVNNKNKKKARKKAAAYCGLDFEGKKNTK